MSSTPGSNTPASAPAALSSSPSAASALSSFDDIRSPYLRDYLKEILRSQRIAQYGIDAIRKAVTNEDPSADLDTPASPALVAFANRAVQVAAHAKSVADQLNAVVQTTVEHADVQMRFDGVFQSKQV